jgi:D-sedoheptulose 7-phosphate isomerase
LSDELKELVYEAMADREKMLRAGKNYYPDAIHEIAMELTIAIGKKRKLLICGNGGSAADSQHFAAEMIVRLTSKLERKALPAIALTTDTSVLTACGNDYGYEHIFSRQVSGLGRKGDILIAISTSGNSPNILKAIETASEKSIIIIGLLGNDGGAAKENCDHSIIVPSKNVMRVQEEYIFILHTLVEMVEQMLIEEA